MLLTHALRLPYKDPQTSESTIKVLWGCKLLVALPCKEPKQFRSPTGKPKEAAIRRPKLRTTHMEAEREASWIAVLFKGPLFRLHVSFPECKLWLLGLDLKFC